MRKFMPLLLIKFLILLAVRTIDGQVTDGIEDYYEDDPNSGDASSSMYEGSGEPPVARELKINRTNTNKEDQEGSGSFEIDFEFDVDVDLEGSGKQIYGATPSSNLSSPPDFPDTNLDDDTNMIPEEVTQQTIDIDELVTGVSEASTEAHWQSIKKGDSEDDSETVVLGAEPDGLLATGKPEGSTEEPYMPKPPKPHVKPQNITDDEVLLSGETVKPPRDADVEEVQVSEVRELATEAAPNMYSSAEYSDASKWITTTTTMRSQTTITQKIDVKSEGYNSLLHMIEDLNNRRNETIPMTEVHSYYNMQIADETAQSAELIVPDQISNITKSQEYIKNLMTKASAPVRQAYSQIITITSDPTFYYTPKRQRYLTINKIITDLGSTYSSEMMNLNTDAKKYCRQCNVDTPPYTLGNLVGNRLSNGAVLTK